MQKSTIVSLLLSSTAAQQVGTQKAETHPKMTLGECTVASGCTNKENSVVMDANWRWLHNVGGYTNCYEGNDWDKTFCPNDLACAQNCALDGIPETDWKGTYGVETSGSDLKLGFVTKNG